MLQRLLVFTAFCVFTPFGSCLERSGGPDSATATCVGAGFVFAGFSEGLQGGRLKRAVPGLPWGWGKAKPDREVQETFPRAGSSLQKRALGLCWSCFSPAPSLPARCILMSTFASLCPHAGGTFRLHCCGSKLLSSAFPCL